MRLLACLIAALPTVAAANDGFGGLSATGLTFGQTEAVAMEREDLFIGMDRIHVDYVFRNITDADVSGEVIFPLPPIALGAMLESAFNLPEDIDRENLMNFKAVVDGVEVPVQIDRIAVIEPAWDPAAPLSQQYDAPGREVTAELAGFGIGLSLDSEAINAQLLALDAGTQARLTAAGLVEFYSSVEGMPPDQAYPLWSVILRYHWTQDFPAGKSVAISHDYENHPPGGLFGWEYPVQADYLKGEQARYCVDDGTSRAIVKALTQTQDGAPYVMGMAHNIAYVLRTANSWAGPIGTFRLTLDKGAPGNVISLCADGIKKIGPTSFLLEKTNYTPERDLEILVASPIAVE